MLWRAILTKAFAAATNNLTFHVAFPAVSAG